MEHTHKRFRASALRQSGYGGGVQHGHMRATLRMELFHNGLRPRRSVPATTRPHKAERLLPMRHKKSGSLHHSPAPAPRPRRRLLRSRGRSPRQSKGVRTRPKPTPDGGVQEGSEEARPSVARPAVCAQGEPAPAPEAGRLRIGASAARLAKPGLRWLRAGALVLPTSWRWRLCEGAPWRIRYGANEPARRC